MLRANGSFKKSLVSMMTLMLAFVVVLAGCSTGASTDKTSNGANGTPQQGEMAYVVKHAMGETKVPKTPERVVILTNEGTEALLALGVKPVGAVQSWTGNPWYPHIADQMKGVEVLGKEDQPSLEKIAALKPDLIIGNKMRQEKIYQQLSAIAPTVFSETLRGDWKQNFQLYAQAVNKKAEGDNVMADWTKHIADFKQKAGDKLKTKVSVVRFMPGKVRIYYNDTFSGIIFKELGLARPAAQDQAKFSDDVTKERIPDMEGDMMFYFTYETGEGQATKLEKEWTQDPLFKNLSVVKSGKAYKVDDVIWNTSGGVLSANLLLNDLEKYLLK